MSEEECYLESKEDYERIMSQGNREDMERLLEYNIIQFKETKKRTGTIKVLNEYAKVINPNIPEEPKIKDVYDFVTHEEKYGKKKEKQVFSFTMEEMVDSFLEINPIFYDKNKLIWRWNKEKFFYEQIDITDLRISIGEARKQGIAIKREFIDFILERARLRIPKNPEKTWIQSKDKIYDYSTGKTIAATPDYFITNPLPYEMGESEDTPTIDKLFTEWVGEKYKSNLYEIIAYSLTPYQFMQRIFALVGGGSNGKGTFVDLLQRVIGKGNYVASELKLLAEKNFETSVLYKQLLCVIGEVGYDDLKNTSQIKKLTGEDEIRYEFKGKNIFSDINSATIICLTNSLPATPDKSIGFYRRWLILDFPNEFQLGKNPVENIPEIEFNNLMTKCLRILKELYNTRKFSNEDSLEDRAKRYEEHSNPVMKFIEEFYEEEPDNMIPLRDLCNKFNEEAKKKHLRSLTAKQIGKILREEGFLVGNRKIDDASAVVVMNLKLKTIKTIKTIKNPISSIRIQSTLDLDSNDSNDSNSLKFTQEQIESCGYTLNELEELTKSTEESNEE